MPKFFVWLVGQKGPEAQIWHDVPRTGEGKQKITPLFIEELKGDFEKKSLTELIETFKNKVPSNELERIPNRD